MNSQLSCLSVCVCGWPPDCHRVSVCHTRIVADHRSRYMYGMSMSRVTTSLSMPYHRVGCYGPEVLLVLSIAHRFHTQQDDWAKCRPKTQRVSTPTINGYWVVMISMIQNVSSLQTPKHSYKCIHLNITEQVNKIQHYHFIFFSKFSL